MEAKLKNINWHLWATRPYSLAREFVVIKEYFPLGTQIFLSLPNNKETANYYVDKEGFFSASEQLWEHTLQNYEEHLKSYPKKKKKLLQATQELTRYATEKNDKALLEAYENYLQQVQKFAPYLLLPFVIVEFCEPRIKEEYKDEFSIITEADQAYNYQKMEKMLLEKPLEEVQKKYGWLNCYSVHDKEYNIEELETIKKGLDSAHIKKVFKEFTKHKKNYEQFKDTISDEKDKAEISILHTYAWLRNERIEAWKQVMCELKPFYKYLKNKVDSTLSNKAIGNLSPEEIKAILQGEKIATKEVARRDRAFLYWYTDPKHIHFITNNTEIEEIRELLESGQGQQTTLKGMSASPGKATGQAVIVQSLGELVKIKEGNILVTQNTDPRYTPYMKRCAGIITNEGGVLSHAAITSRELGIPCVIAVKTATKAFKDGDLIEIDADEGIVRKVQE